MTHLLVSCLGLFNILTFGRCIFSFIQLSCFVLTHIWHRGHQDFVFNFVSYINILSVRLFWLSSFVWSVLPRGKAWFAQISYAYLHFHILNACFFVFSLLLWYFEGAHSVVFIFFVFCFSHASMRSVPSIKFYFILPLIFLGLAVFHYYLYAIKLFLLCFHALCQIITDRAQSNHHPPHRLYFVLLSALFGSSLVFCNISNSLTCIIPCFHISCHALLRVRMWKYF